MSAYEEKAESINFRSHSCGCIEQGFLIGRDIK